MPRLSVWMVRAALLHLGVGFTFGALMLWNKGLPFDPALWRLLPAHIELVLMGWTVQLAMGVAFWILPRFAQGHRYGKEWLGWWSFYLLNGGVIACAFGQWQGSTGLAFAGRLIALLAVICFVLMMWRRVKPFAETGLKKAEL